jgi:hypothetical protein
MMTKAISFDDIEFPTSNSPEPQSPIFGLSFKDFLTLEFMKAYISGNPEMEDDVALGLAVETAALYYFHVRGEGSEH